ncbi:hypothetical protein FE257_009022 [Aspergillus nanangensis]|uniref:Glycosyltransferase 2-like domain-containing protein n=1 Tax=Aspergillus nanangensis TaxID=2582783 RepID=A0AAD4CWK4_ASPNN|nr:hypothetical protein FE257_009022 [Aspergillus nanangensis]
MSIASEKSIHDTNQVSVSWLQRIWNFSGCVLGVLVFVLMIKYSKQPLTIDVIFTIVLAEWCRWANNQRRKRATSPKKCDDPLYLLEKGDTTPSDTDVIAAVVGYREEPALFKRALESYLEAQGCRFLLICIDGDTEDDEEMIDVFREACKEDSAVIHLDVPFADIALKMDEESNSCTSENEIVARCCSIARAILNEKGVRFSGKGAISRLCVNQRHMHKKGIMFTSFIISMVVSDILGIDYLWTSDSDSIVFPDTLTRTISTFSTDPKVGGASTALYIHNKDETLITKLGTGVYLNELYLARSFTGSAAANDCQSGPSAVFRVPAVRTELLGWYKQNVLGHWMVVNEDRHLTTRLLLKGWQVVFASDVLTATESPTTLRRWLLQQVRWARAVHVESFHRPGVYLMQSPILFFAAMRRQTAAFLVPTSVTIYVVTGVIPFMGFTIQDLLQRLVLTFVYLFLRNPYRPRLREWLWTFPATLFYHLPLPAIQIWSFVTVLHDSWGTSMRSKKEFAKQSKLRLRLWEVGFFVVWMGIVGGAIGRYTASALMFDPAQTALCILLGIGSLVGLWGSWMVTAE